MTGELTDAVDETRGRPDGARVDAPHPRMALDRGVALGWLLPAWLALFANRAQPYARQQEDGSYRWVHAPCDVHALARHLAGEETIALAALDAGGRCRWACLDADGAEGIAQLRAVQQRLSALGLAALLEASRRGGHLWLLFDQPVPAAAARALLRESLRALVASTPGFTTTGLELYPDSDQPGALGHAVRLPLGVHRRTGQRYPLLDVDGAPLVFPDRTAALAYLLAHPRILSTQLEAALTIHAREEGAAPPLLQPAPARALGQPDPQRSRPAPPRPGTWSPVIRWVDAHVSPLDLLDELCPRAELRPAGQGYLGWCPFHDDRAANEVDGRPGTPSFYVVENSCYGWSWRCLSSNCPCSIGPMKHSFRLFQLLLGLDGEAGAAIRAAYARWPELEGGGSPLRVRRRQGRAGRDARGDRSPRRRGRRGEGR